MSPISKYSAKAANEASFQIHSLTENLRKLTTQLVSFISLRMWLEVVASYMDFSALEEPLCQRMEV